MEESENPYERLFQKQQRQQYQLGNSKYKQRIQKLNALQEALEVTYKAEIQAALWADFKKPALEVDLTEIYPVVAEIKYIKRNLKKWMRGKSVKSPMAMLGASSKIHYEPKGVCLIISPWNFPINLSFGPLVAAIAAGNAVILKPSEITQNASSLIAKIVRDVFSEDEVAVLEGAVETATALLKLPFNHIFFTGSPAVGKVVMAAAAKNLASVTLELGGKSPVIIDRSADLRLAARRVAWGKLLNNGQICVAPDYVLIHESLQEEFIDLYRAQIQYFYTDQPKESPDYSRIVSDKQFERIVNYIADAQQLGAVISIGGDFDAHERYIAPTLVCDLPKTALLLKEEIFGPVLPLITFKNKEEVVDYIQAGAKPLALYIYVKDSERIDYYLRNTRAGGTVVNHNILHYSSPYLPFGGSNNSGIGKANGFYGFLAFSNERAFVKQYAGSPADMLFPPYTSFKQRLINLTLKWF